MSGMGFLSAKTFAATFYFPRFFFISKTLSIWSLKIDIIPCLVIPGFPFSNLTSKSLYFFDISLMALLAFSSSSLSSGENLLEWRVSLPSSWQWRFWGFCSSSPWCFWGFCSSSPWRFWGFCSSSSWHFCSSSPWCFWGFCSFSPCL